VHTVVEWYCRRAGSVAQTHAHSLIGAVACALAPATKSFARFVKFYVDLVDSRPLILAALQGVWHATRSNDAAVKAGTVVPPPLPPAASVVQAVLDALGALMARTPAPGGAPAPGAGAANVPVDDAAIGRLMAFVVPFVPRVDVVNQIGAIATLSEAQLGAALRVFGVERLPSALKNRYRPIAVTLPVLLVELHRVTTARASLPFVARSIALSVGLCTLDYVAAHTVLELLEQEKPLPSLLLKTLLQIKETYPTFRNLTLASLSRLAKQPTSVWDDKVLWKGFSIACRKLEPHSFGALAELPTMQRELFFVENPTMFEPFRAYVASEQARVAQAGHAGANGATDKTYRRPLVGVPVAALVQRSCARAPPTNEDMLHDAYAIELVPGSDKALANAAATLGPGKSDDEVADAAAAALAEVAPEGRAVLSVRRPSQVRLGTYNLLADQLAKPERFPYCAPEMLQWENRKKKIMAEIHQRKPDILCLQQMEYWDSFFENQLHNEGMASLFKVRTGTAKDGVAICWSKDRYQLVLEHKIEFNNLAFVNPSNPASRRLLHDSVALIAVLDPVRTRRGVKRALATIKHNLGDEDDANIDPTHNLDSRQRLLVASCELCRDPRFADVRVMQTKMLLETLEKLVITTKSKDSPGMQVLLCGGLNAEPTSGVYQLLASGELPKEHADIHSFKMFQDVRHRLGLQSAYRTVFDHEPEFTTLGPHQTATVDYIWFSQSQLSCIGALQVPSRDDVERDTGLPSPSNGSDHVLVMAVFESIV
jgi:CCR4-NOT transcription complex subunit 6